MRGEEENPLIWTSSRVAISRERKSHHLYRVPKRLELLLLRSRVTTCLMNEYYHLLLELNTFKADPFGLLSLIANEALRGISSQGGSPRQTTPG